MPVSTLRIKVARTAVLVRTGPYILWSERRENKKKAKEAPRWKARDRKKAAQERLGEKTVRKLRTIKPMQNKREKSPT